ncbi:hypothetical protein CL629_02715 [bacterium]|nr:hypothetical protein [bacterium]|tara:strand:- start:984 stop:1229 length:246 start_codon:yes stop_codon:yes gene_type:complete
MPAIIVKKGKGAAKERPAIVVGKRVFAKAVERNRIRRRIRVIIGQRIQKNRERYTIIVGPEAKALTFEELRQEIEKQLSKV